MKSEALIVMLVLLLGACVDATEVAEKPLPEPTPASTRDRHVALEGQHNFRDLGGYETVDGRTVKWGEVYRSGELPGLTDEDVDKLAELGLRTVVNFLLPQEIEKEGSDRLPEGTREVPRPISGDRAAQQTMMVTSAIMAAEFDKVPPEINPEFHRLLVDEGRDVYAALLRDIADPANRPLAFHCSHGIHRTGTATAILLSALGVPWETIREDYLLSNEYRRGDVSEELDRIRRMAAQKKGIAPEEVDMTNVEAFYVLDGAYIDGALAAAVEGWGSMDGYIREGLGLTDEGIDRLKAELLE
jgi:protein-tyrosine phosphatase